MGYDRVLERLYRISDGWVVKGAAALLARGLAVRATRDIDVFRAVAQGPSVVDVRVPSGKLTDDTAVPGPPDN